MSLNLISALVFFVIFAAGAAMDTAMLWRSERRNVLVRRRITNGKDKPALLKNCCLSFFQNP